MANENSVQKTNYLNELLICGSKPTIQKVVKKSNTKFTAIGNKLISKEIIENFQKISKQKNEIYLCQIKQFNNAKKMLMGFQKSIFSSKAQISYGSNGNSITITDLTNGDMATSQLGEI